MLFEIVGQASKGEYVYAIVPNHPKKIRHGYVLMHRVVMENHLGRLLTDKEIVHHIDGNKKNNSIDNLRVMTASLHASLHQKTGRDMVTCVCPQCGKVFERERRRVKPGKAPFCSRRCNGIYQQARNWNKNPNKTSLV